MKVNEKLFDVVVVGLITNKVSIIETGKTERNADAIVTMAVMRRGCDGEFFAAVPTGSLKEGDAYKVSPE